MNLTVGEIAKVLGVSTEMIRHYVRTGIITPKQNENNKYWEYSSEDVLLLSDILFYREVDIPLKDIEKIFKGLSLEEIGELIIKRKNEIAEEIKLLNKTLSKLQEWEEAFFEEMELLNKFVIGNMPSEFRNAGFYDGEEHIINYLNDKINVKKHSWMYASFSFYYNIHEKSSFKRYFSLNKNEETEIYCKDAVGIIEEKAEKCIYTQVLFSDNINEMIDPLIQYARENEYQLTGEVYGRENTNYFKDGKRLGLYRIYAPIK